jgi:anaerobic ribonucleoside-triphosphate reductase activating protein
MRIAYPVTPTWLDYPDDESYAILIYVMGCEHNCDGCHNPQFRDHLYEEDSKTVTPEQLLEIVKRYSEIYQSNKIIFSGGDPISKRNFKEVQESLILLKNAGFDNVVYTGYDIDHVIKTELTAFDYIKCGTYEKDLAQIPEKTNEYMSLASINQEIYDARFQLLTKDGKLYFNKR